MDLTKLINSIPFEHQKSYLWELMTSELFPYLYTQNNPRELPLEVLMRVPYGDFWKLIPVECGIHLKKRFSGSGINRLVDHLNTKLNSPTVDREGWLKWIFHECSIRKDLVMAHGMLEALENTPSWLMIEAIRQVYPHYFTRSEQEQILAAFNEKKEGIFDSHDAEQRAYNLRIVHAFGLEMGDLMRRVHSVTLMERAPSVISILHFNQMPDIAEAKKNETMFWSKLLASGLMTIKGGKAILPELLLWWMSAKISMQRILADDILKIKEKGVTMGKERDEALRLAAAHREFSLKREAEIGRLERINRENNAELQQLRRGALQTEMQSTINRQSDIIEKLCQIIDDMEEKARPVIAPGTEQLIPPLVEIPHPEFVVKGLRVLVIGGFDSLPKLRERYAQAASLVWVEAGQYRRLTGTIPQVDLVILDHRKNSHAMTALAKARFGKIKVI